MNEQTANLLQGLATKSAIKPRKRKLTPKERSRRVRAFMDGIDWEHHVGVGNDSKGTLSFPSVQDTKREKSCLAKGARCGIVEVEIRLIRWAVEQRLDLERKKRRADAARRLK